MDFLIRRPELLAATVGGKPIVLQNPVYNRLNTLVQKFSITDAQAEDRFFQLATDRDDAPVSMISNKGFAKKPMFVGDTRDGAELFPSPTMTDRDLN